MAGKIIPLYDPTVNIIVNDREIQVQSNDPDLQSVEVAYHFDRLFNEGTDVTVRMHFSKKKEVNDSE